MELHWSISLEFEIVLFLDCFAEFCKVFHGNCKVIHIDRNVFINRFVFGESHPNIWVCFGWLESHITQYIIKSSCHLAPGPIACFVDELKVSLEFSKLRDSNNAKFSSAYASRYTFPMSAPHSSRLLSSAKNMVSLRFLGETTPK